MLSYEAIKPLNVHSSIFRQEYTWGRFRLTFDAFSSILSAYHPFSSYSDFVQAFGYREDDDLKQRNGYCWKPSYKDRYDGGHPYAYGLQESD